MWCGIGLVNLSEEVNLSEGGSTITEPVQNSYRNIQKQGSLGSLGSPDNAISETMKPSEPNSNITEPVQNSYRDIQDKGSDGYEGYANDALVQAAKDLGGEVANVITLGDGTTMPF